MSGVDIWLQDTEAVLYFGDKRPLTSETGLYRVDTVFTKYESYMQYHTLAKNINHPIYSKAYSRVQNSVTFLECQRWYLVSMYKFALYTLHDEVFSLNWEKYHKYMMHRHVWVNIKNYQGLKSAVNNP